MSHNKECSWRLRSALSLPGPIEPDTSYLLRWLRSSYFLLSNSTLVKYSIRSIAFSLYLLAKYVARSLQVFPSFPIFPASSFL